jgi:Sulfotransferase domain
MSPPDDEAEGTELAIGARPDSVCPDVIAESTNRATKVFGIGLSRTGTKSLHVALGILGLRSVHYPRLDTISEVMQSHDAAVDTPVACSFFELDSLFPESKFILTVRDFRTWLLSTQRFFSGPLPEEAWQREVRLKTYGVLRWDRAAFLRAYHRHVELVLDYFEHRPHRLLVINIVGGEGWDLLCPFLGMSIPEHPFPHANQSNT